MFTTKENKSISEAEVDLISYSLAIAMKEE